jgi:RAB protein geranylgeranyltransferase component A
MKELSLQSEKVAVLKEVIAKVMPLVTDNKVKTAEMLEEMKRYIESIMLTDF